MATETELDVDEPRELPAFNLEEHELMHSVQAEHLVLDVFTWGTTSAGNSSTPLAAATTPQLASNQMRTPCLRASRSR
ncbi:hypothetical protein N5K55_38065 (plasmid) [Pseudomonas aeruginosa]|nr:hypothetical protein [Pseudomonas aeruginosa]